MIRYALLTLFILVVPILAAKDWFKALCVMLPMLAFLERPDMPREMLGVQGLNPFNLMLLSVLAGWMVQKKKEGLQWDLDARVNRLLWLHLLILLIATLRAMPDMGGMVNYAMLTGRPKPTVISIGIDGILNTYKMIIPGLLVCHGANSPERVKFVMWSMAATAMFLGLQTIKLMLPALLGGEDLGNRALRVLDRDLGYHRVELASIMGSLSWAFFAMRSTSKSGMETAIMWSGFLICTIAMVSTGGRAGMVAWAACGAFVAFLRYRYLLVLGPIGVAAMLVFIPGVQDRMLQGFTEDTHAEGAANKGIDLVTEGGADLYQITSGRMVIWPYVIEEAQTSPIYGHGRYAMRRQGVTQRAQDVLGDAALHFPHPHNAYLELVLDTGLVGAFIVLYFYLTIGVRAARVFKKVHDPTLLGVASLALVFLLVQGVSMMGSMSFYPKQSALFFWISIGLAMRYLKSDVVGDVASQHQERAAQLPPFAMRGYRR